METKKAAKRWISSLSKGVCIGLLVWFLGGTVQAAGLLKPVNGSEADVFIESHQVHVTINNGFARTEVDQVFGNNTDTDLEAIYSFPLPKQASLSELSLWIDGQEVVGEVLEKEQARQVYEEQVQKGNDTALAEQDEYRTFDISVCPVRAGQDTRVRLVYYQPLEIDSNVGRYLYPLAEGGVDEERIAFWSVDNQVHGAFRFEAVIKSAFPIQDVRVPGYTDTAAVENISQDPEASGGQSDAYRILIESPEGNALSRDIVVYYRLADNVPARVELIPYRESKNSTGTFMVVITPAADLQPIAEGVDWTFVLDVSGSMSGGKIATLTDGVCRVIGRMSPNDRFRIITFNQNARDFSGGYITATPANVQGMLARIRSIQAEGSTNLFAGIEMAYRGLEDDRTTGVIIVTDGVANTGPTEHSQFLKLLEQYDVRLFTFIIGNSANVPLMERLAKESNGFAMTVSDSDDITGRILQAKSKILYEGMHDVELVFGGEKVKELTPARIGSLYQGQQVVAFGRYDGDGRVRLELKAKISGQPRSWQCLADLPETDTANPELERLWALSRIEEVMEKIRETGQTQSLRKQVADLGTEYSLVTEYTSMVVLSEKEMESVGIQRRNADRVHRERQAQQQRINQPVQNYRVDQNQNTFNNRPAPGIGNGSGPVGPLFIGLTLWLAGKKKRN
jgi:Ca-activated chloride channel family protein